MKCLLCFLSSSIHDIPRTCDVSSTKSSKQQAVAVIYIVKANSLLEILPRNQNTNNTLAHTSLNSPNLCKHYIWEKDKEKNKEKDNYWYSPLLPLPESIGSTLGNSTHNKILIHFLFQVWLDILYKYLTVVFKFPQQHWMHVGKWNQYHFSMYISYVELFEYWEMFSLFFFKFFLSIKFKLLYYEISLTNLHLLLFRLFRFFAVEWSIFPCHMYYIKGK